MNTVLLTLSIYAWPLYFSIICDSESLMCVMGLRSWLQVAEEEVKELIGETTVTLIRSMKPERSFVGCYTLSLVSKQNADVGRCLAWKKRWTLEHLSAYSSQNTNLLENKRGKKFFFHGQRIWETSYTLSLHAALGIHTTGDAEIPAIKERPKE